MSPKFSLVASFLVALSVFPLTACGFGNTTGALQGGFPLQAQAAPVGAAAAVGTTPTNAVPNPVASVTPTPAPSPTSLPTPTPTPSPLPSPTPTPSPLPSPTPTYQNVAPIPFAALEFIDNPGGNGPKAVALTFDDGPDGSSGGNTAYILDQLQALGVHATFFVCGDVWTQVATDPNAQHDLHRIINEGHGIGNHTMSHPHLSTLTAAQVEAELTTNETLMAQVLGPTVPPLTMVRAPYGDPFQNDTASVDAVAEVTARHGVHIGWAFDSYDWDCAQNDNNAACVLRNVNAALDRGRVGVILMHAVYKITGDALPSVVQSIYNHGYHIVSVEDMIAAKYGASSLSIWHANSQASFSPQEIDHAATLSCGENNSGNVYQGP